MSENPPRQLVCEDSVLSVWDDLDISLCGQQHPKCKPTIRLLYPALFFEICSSTKPTTKDLTDLVLLFQQLYLGKLLELDTRSCEIFLAIADNISFQNIDVSSWITLYSSTNWRCHCINNNDDCTIPKHQIMFLDFSLKNLRGSRLFWYFTQPW